MLPPSPPAQPGVTALCSIYPVDPTLSRTVIAALLVSAGALFPMAALTGIPSARFAAAIVDHAAGTRVIIALRTASQADCN